ncbi:MAG: AMP-binding protein [Candidatus Puniceispirillaceae bacterium]
MMSFADLLKPQGGKSIVTGPVDPPLLEMSIPELLATTTRRLPDQTAAVFADKNIRWSYQEFYELTLQMAAGLLALGVAPGDRVGIWSPNRWEWVALQYASAQIGAILVSINPAYRRAELEYALNKTGVSVLMLAEQFKSSDYIAMIEALAPELASHRGGVLHLAKLPHLNHLVHMGTGDRPGMMTTQNLMQLATDRLIEKAKEIGAGLDRHDPINIQFTSGTTGAPKGATLTHANIINNGRFTVERMGLQQGEMLCLPVPLYHCFGMVMGSLGCVAIGAGLVFPGEAFEPLATLKAIAAEKCAALYSVPTMFLSMLDHEDFSQFDISSLRTGIMAGAPCPMEVMKRVTREMNLREITIAYGMTETSPVSFQSHPDDPLEMRVSTVGRIHPHVSVKIVDEAGQTLPVGVQGELWTKGYSVMHGYWAEAEKTQSSITKDGWMRTGDLATLDENGFARITGRLKDMVIRGGENIYPREIEEFLYRHPAIQQVQVFGVPDKKYGEELCAYIILNKGMAASEEDIRGFCTDEIAHYKIPRYIRIVTAMPMTVTGKPQKFMMRDEMIKALKLNT